MESAELAVESAELAVESAKLVSAGWVRRDKVGNKISVFLESK